MVLHVYLPNLCLGCKDGVVLGKVSNGIVFGIAIVELPFTPKILNQYLADTSSDISIIGSFTNVDQFKKHENSGLQLIFGRKSLQWIQIQKCQKEIKVKSNSSENVILTMYDQTEFWHVENGITHELTNIISHQKAGVLSFKAAALAEEHRLSIKSCCVDRSASLLLFMITTFTTLFLNFTANVCLFLQSIINRTLFQPLKWLHQLFCYAINLSSTGYHICLRSTQFKNAIMKFSNDKTQKNFYFAVNLLSAMFMDIAIGLAVVYFLNYYKIPQIIFTNELLLDCIEIIGHQIEEIIEWLMGIPAGLKLNDPLNRFLGQFFKYHVSLWLEYLRLLMSTIPHLVSNLVYGACFGLSFGLMLASDLVSLLSFHVYVFYTYAGRLYNLQVTGLISLWRLFLGKKWNPLRKRVDTLDLEYQNTDRLFVGTLLFTILLFLLPTTLLYYAIFAMLRLVVHLIQRCLWFISYVSSNFPLFYVLQYIWRPQVNASDIRYEWIDTKENQLQFNIGIVSQSLKEVVNAGYVEHSTNYIPVNLQQFLKKLVVGELMKWNVM